MSLYHSCIFLDSLCKKSCLLCYANSIASAVICFDNDGCIVLYEWNEWQYGSCAF